MSSDDRDERPVDVDAIRYLRESLTEGLERLGDRLVEAIDARANGVPRELTADERVKLATKLLEGTSYEAVPK